MVTVALVHERLTEFAGSEAVLAELARSWPEAPILTPIARAGVMPQDVEARVTPTWLSHALVGTTYAHLLPLLPMAMRRLKVPDADVIIASHHAFANQVVHATEVPVISYVHSPARWVWDKRFRAGEGGGRAGAAVLAGFSQLYKPADVRAAARVVAHVANSTAVAERIANWWGQDAQIVHPPVDTDYYSVESSASRSDFFLLAGRLVPYKRPDLAIRAATAAGVPLVVAGDGRAAAELRTIAGPTVRFVGRVSDEELRRLYRSCAALVMPGIEDFGIVPVEAQACGAPVIATDAGGAQDTVIAGHTGQLIPESRDAREELEAWKCALEGFSPGDFEPKTLQAHAQRFSRASFARRMQDVVNAAHV